MDEKLKFVLNRVKTPTPNDFLGDLSLLLEEFAFQENKIKGIEAKTIGTLVTHLIESGEATLKAEEIQAIGKVLVSLCQITQGREAMLSDECGPAKLKIGVTKPAVGSIFVDILLVLSQFLESAQALVEGGLVETLVQLWSHETLGVASTRPFVDLSVLRRNYDQNAVTQMVKLLTKANVEDQTRIVRSLWNMASDFNMKEVILKAEVMHHVVALLRGGLNSSSWCFELCRCTAGLLAYLSACESGKIAIIEQEELLGELVQLSINRPDTEIKTNVDITLKNTSDHPKGLSLIGEEFLENTKPNILIDIVGDVRAAKVALVFLPFGGRQLHMALKALCLIKNTQAIWNLLNIVPALVEIVMRSELMKMKDMSVDVLKRLVTEFKVARKELKIQCERNQSVFEVLSSTDSDFATLLD